MPITGSAPSGASTLAFVEAFPAHKHATGASAWEDWDISAIVPVGCVVVFIHVWQSSSGSNAAGVRTNDSALDRRIGLYDYGSCVFPVAPDANRIIEIYAASTSAVEFTVLGWLV